MRYVKKNQVIAIIHWNSLKVRFICAQWYNVDVPIWVLTSGPFYNHGRKNRYFSGIIHLFLNQILKLGHGCATSTSRTRSSEQAPIPGFLLPIFTKEFSSYYWMQMMCLKSPIVYLLIQKISLSCILLELFWTCTKVNGVLLCLSEIDSLVICRRVVHRASSFSIIIF